MAVADPAGMRYCFGGTISALRRDSAASFAPIAVTTAVACIAGCVSPRAPWSICRAPVLSGGANSAQVTLRAVVGAEGRPPTCGGG